jgi:uncharacterized membrane protein
MIVIALCVLAAAAYGTSDFAAGLASRRATAGLVTATQEVVTLPLTALAVVLFQGHGPNATALAWGAVSGVGTAVGTLSLYHGLSVARMSTVATLSAVLAAAIPLVIGVLLGNHLTLGSGLGIALAVPAIALISWEPEAEVRRASRAGLLYGSLAGSGFALLFVALDRAGTRAGAWPLVPDQLVALLLFVPFACRGLTGFKRPSRSTLMLTFYAGGLGAAGNLLFLDATGRGELAIIAVVSSLYPAATVVLARAFLSERWSRMQTTGLLTSLAAIVLVSLR